MADLQHLSDEELREHLAQIAGTTTSSLHGAYLELERRGRARMWRRKEQMGVLQARSRGVSERSRGADGQNAAGTKTLVKLTWAIVVLAIVNVVVVLVAVF
jgi:hypothetical protein